MEAPKVCITGVSGYLGSWVLKTFLDWEEQKFEIRGTVRDPNNEKKIAPLQESLGERFSEVELVAADLTDAESIDKAIEGCDYVVHTASPFPVKLPKNDDEIINPAVEGTKAVLEACRKHKVKRLVLTSSIVAVMDYSRDSSGSMLDEENWLDDYDHAKGYPKSKAMAERTVWKFIDDLPDDEKFDAVSINPGFILGPVLVKSEFSSALVASKTLRGKYPGMPDIYTGLVDVRDVAEAHLRAITQKVPVGRYIWVEGNYEFAHIGRVLYDEFNQYGYKPTRKKMKYCMVKIGALFIAEAKGIIDSWGKNIQFSNKKIKETMNMEFRDSKDTINEMGYSLIDQGYVPDKRK